MKTARVIYEEGGHKWIALVRDPNRPDYVIDTNEYLVTDGDDAILVTGSLYTAGAARPVLQRSAN